MPNYNNGKIYKIISENTDNVYIGSTTQSLCKRLANHKESMKNGKYFGSRRILEKGKCKIVLLENFPCENREQLFAKEQEWIDKTSNLVNLKSAKVSKEKKTQKKKEKIMCTNCCRYISRGHMSRHKKTERCIYYNKHNPNYREGCWEYIGQ